MENDILGKVVHVETEIQKMIETEKNMARERIEEARKKAEEGLVHEENRLNHSLDITIRDAQLSFKKEASEMVEKARADAERIDGLSDDQLRRIILKHLHIILPG
jgi:vacuolar-type H+-ATPase subunit H